MTALFCLLLAVFAINSSYGYYDKVLLRNVQVLTFKEGRLTTSRRNVPVQQLLCTNCYTQEMKNVVTSMQCFNTGFDGKDVNWKCKSEISKKWLLSNVDVVCEGYDYPDDPYILVGSCSVEYQLKTNPSYTPPRPMKQPTHNQYQSQKNDNILTFFVAVLVIFCTCIALLSCTSSSTTVTRTSYHYPEMCYTDSTQTSTRPISVTPVKPVTPITPVIPVTQVTPVTPVVQVVQNQPTYTDGLVTGMVLGSATQPPRQQPVIVQQVQKPVPPTMPVVQVTQLDPIVVEGYVDESSEKEKEKHTSTSYGTTKRK